MIKKQLQLILFTIKMIIDINKKLFIIVLILSLSTSIFPIIALMITQEILNMIHSMTVPFHEIVVLILIYSIFSIVTVFIQNIYSYFSNQLNIYLMYSMNYKFMEKCAQLPLTKIEETNTYEMITRLESEIAVKPYQALSAIITIISTSVTFIFSLSILFSWKIELIFLFIIMSFIAFFFNIKVAEYDFQMRFRRSEKERKVWYYSFLLTHDTGFKEVKLLNLKDYFLKKYWALVKSFIHLENNINRMQIIISVVVLVMQDITAGFIMFLTIREAYLGVILIGTAILYMNMATTIQNSTSGLATNIHSLYNCNLYISLLKEFLSIKVEESSGNVEINDIEFVEVKDLCYNYPDKKEVLKGISFDIKKGECVAVVGENGSGKSTLLKLLCGLYSPSSGVIKINGNKLSNINMRTYRNKISVLFQDFLRLESSLLENIHLGHIEKEVRKEEIKKALQHAGVNFLKRNNDYLYDSYLGNWFEGGSQLSGGEWQKVALARVYYKDALMYILDEPSSALDVNSEIKIFNQFFKRSKNNMGIFITHRVKIAKQADKIIVLDQGEVVAVGSHKYLYDHCPLYKNLLTKEQELDYST